MSHQGEDGWFPECMICNGGNLGSDVVCLSCQEKSIQEERKRILKLIKELDMKIVVYARGIGKDKEVFVLDKKILTSKINNPQQGLFLRTHFVKRGSMIRSRPAGDLNKRLCPKHNDRLLDDSGYCQDCGDYPYRHTLDFEDKEKQ